MKSTKEILAAIFAEQGLTYDNSERSEEELRAEDKHRIEILCEAENQKTGTLQGYACSLCKNKGVLYRLELYRGRYEMIQVPCSCQKTRRSIQSLCRSGLSSVVEDFTFDKFIATEHWQQRLLEKAKGYLNEADDHWLFFGGNSGSGKTHLCSAVAISLLREGKEVKYMLWRNEASRLKAIVNDSAYAHEIEYYKTVDVLYIDDLFKTGKGEGQQMQRPTAADISLAFEIINDRAMQKKITIISSENTFDELCEIDEAIAGRIKQHCGTYCVSIERDPAKNYRLQKAK